MLKLSIDIAMRVSTAIIYFASTELLAPEGQRYLNRMALCLVGFSGFW
jgi:hypothetical protein